MNYREREGLNYSLLKDYNKSPDDAIYTMSGKRKFSAATLNNFKLGHALEAFVYPGQIDSIAIIPEFNRRTKTGKVDYESFMKFCDETNKIAITKDEGVMLKMMSDNIKKCPYILEDIGEYLKKADEQGNIEKEIYWHDFDLDMKVKIDFMIEEENQIHIFDLKTHGREMSKFFWNFKEYLWIQAIHYLHAVRSISDKNLYFNFIVGSKEAPYVCKLWTVSASTIEKKTQDYYSLINSWKNWIECGMPAAGHLEEGVL